MRTILKCSNWVIASFFYLFILSFLVFIIGCSIIGLAIGSKTQKDGEVKINGWEVEKVKIGEKIKVVIDNSDTVIGEYGGVEFKLIDEYTQEYNQSKASLNEKMELPKIGDKILLSNQNNFNVSEQSNTYYFFEGFGYNTIILKTIDDRTKIVSLFTDNKIKLESEVFLNKAEAIERIKSLEIPVRSYLTIKETPQLVKKVNPAKLTGPIIIYRGKSGSYALEGLAVGLGIDLFAAVVFISSVDIGLKDNAFNSEPSMGSCPMVYSYDGKNYKLDSEPFGGSIYKAAQRTDVDKLEYLQANEGFYRFKLANELDETQYVDEFKLMVVDHPEQITLLPSFDGKIHAFSSLVPPVSAIDQNGNEVLDKVNKKDDNYWVSYPFNRSPEVNGDERDALILEFEKPAGAEQVKLAFNVQNTIWAASLQKELISMQGSSINEWYAYMEKSPEARSLFTEAMIREGMLLVKEWTGSEWVTRDFVWEVGPAIPKDQAMVINILPNDNPKLRIKLESTVGLWMINSVFADFKQQETFTVTELSPVKAVSQDSRNVLDLITKEDGTYYEMPHKTDWALIEFKSLPKAAKGFKRSYFLKCGGYYHIHVNNSIEPNQQLIRELIAKPGAYGKYTLRSLNEKLSAVIE